MSSRRNDFQQLRKLNSTRSNTALVEVHKQKKIVAELENSRLGIQACLDGLSAKSRSLDMVRAQADKLSVEQLRCETNTRKFIEEDIQHQLTLLEESEQALKRANGMLLAAKSNWRSHVNKEDALSNLQFHHQLVEAQLEDAKRDSEMDEFTTKQQGRGVLTGA